MSKRYYETTFIVDSILEDDKVDSIISRYTGFFTKNSGEVVKTNKWGRKKLAYPVKKRTTGSYISIEFTAEPSIIAKLERAYHLDDDVLRFLTISYDKKSLETRDTYLARREAEEKARAEAKLELLHQAENPAAEVIPEVNVQPLPVDKAGMMADKAGDAEAKEKEKSE
jgi:small subunit ribosomal protein S6